MQQTRGTDDAADPFVGITESFIDYEGRDKHQKKQNWEEHKDGNRTDAVEMMQVNRFIVTRESLVTKTERNSGDYSLLTRFYLYLMIL